MHQVIPAYRQAVTITRDNPDIEFGVRQLQTRRNCRRTTVNRVKTISLDVIRKTRRATDARNKRCFFRPCADIGQCLGYRFENRIITATRTPSYFLRRREILGSKHSTHRPFPLKAGLLAATTTGANIERIFSTNSEIRNG